MTVLQTVGGTVLADNLCEAYGMPAGRIVARFDIAKQKNGEPWWYSGKQYAFPCSGVVKIGDRVVLEFRSLANGCEWTARPLKRGETI